MYGWYGTLEVGTVLMEVGTVLTGLIDSFTEFQTKYTQYGNNFEVVPVFSNVNFGFGRNQSIKLDTNFFGADNIRTHFQIISKLSWQDCTVNGTFVGTVKRPKFDILFGENIFFSKIFLLTPP